MKTSKVYLAGPIAGLDFAGATDWRRLVAAAMPPGIVCYSPMRGKDYLAGVQRFGTHGYDEHPLSAERGIMARDHWDTRTADLVLVNLLGARRVSMGTVMEMAWAFAYRVPTVVAIEPDGSNVHEHAMVREAIDFRCCDLDEAVETAVSILSAAGRPVACPA